MVKFISYDGKYPCLCMGTLIIEVDGKSYFLNNVLISGGSVSFTKDWEEIVDQGDWRIDLKEYPELEPYKEEIAEIVNENIRQGCCGGCI